MSDNQHPAYRWARQHCGTYSVSGEKITVDRVELGNLVHERELLAARHATMQAALERIRDHDRTDPDAVHYMAGEAHAALAQHNASDNSATGQKGTD